MENVGRIEISERLTEISKILMKIVEKDVNVNVGAISAQILAEIAKKSRFSFSALALRAFPVVFDKLKDKNAILRDALVEFCDEAANTTPLSAYSEAGLSNKNPQARQQTALFLSRFFAKNDPKIVETEEVKQLAEHILKTSNDADKEVRKAALRIVAAVQKCLGEGVAKRLLAEVYHDKLKTEKLPPLIEELEKEFESSASPEMLRLAKHYKIGSSSTSAPPKTAAGAPKRLSSAVAPRRAPPASAAPTRRAPSPKAPVVAPTRRAPSPKAPVAPVAPVKPKPFVARPAPNFGKPRAAVAPARAPQITQRAPAATRPATSAIRVIPIAPNVVRNGAPAAPRKPIEIARPQTSSGIAAPGAPRSRIGTKFGWKWTENGLKKPEIFMKKA
ncbi:TOG domain-containing protein [Caenorhabditis elegans]|uniref:TOG domain-containing protein n=1 Tax=Caenorhabditis elegans TaxID=6239 RepID=A4F325_CAEEL|nr:TOG domain-containing protein [Caenorhabditis elegans]CCD74404.1 TOG domain-containing protein [Caenorhabditis elegans]|eukprot:NP_508061.1 Uncharacterized protein CELE_T08D2.8 [Caenorhabditis elegans]